MKYIYQVKVSRTEWEYILADSMKSVNEYCKENNLSDWRTASMMSRDKISEIRKTAKEI